MGRHRHTHRRHVVALLAAACTAAGLVVAVPGTANAATFLVTTTDDSGPGSLRQVILDTNASPGADLIRFEPEALGPPPYTITMTSAVNGVQVLPPITDQLTIDATAIPGWSPGNPQVQILSGGAFGASALFTIASDNVTLTGLSVAGSGSDGFGTGVDVLDGTANALIAQSQFGVDLAGMNIAGPQLNSGVQVRAAAGVTVNNNLIANAASGVAVLPGALNVEISCNTIGLSRDESHPAAREHERGHDGRDECARHQQHDRRPRGWQ